MNSYEPVMKNILLCATHAVRFPDDPHARERLQNAVYHYQDRMMGEQLPNLTIHVAKERAKPARKRRGTKK
jgi:hypothetical protein